MSKVFVEVGACYFDNLEDLLLEGWTGYFIEPVPTNMSKLIDKVNKRVGNREVNAIFETAVISNYNGIGKFNYIEHSSMREWVAGIGHISSEHTHPAYFKDYNTKFLKENTKQLTTKFITLDNFIEKYLIDSIDIMKIDIEGHEAEVLNSYSWKVKPKHIKIEHTICGLDPLKNILEDQGYTCNFDDEDIYAYYNGNK